MVCGEKGAGAGLLRELDAAMARRVVTLCSVGVFRFHSSGGVCGSLAAWSPPAVRNYAVQACDQHCEEYYDQVDGYVDVEPCAALCDLDGDCVAFSWNIVLTTSGERFCMKCRTTATGVGGGDHWVVYSRLGAPDRAFAYDGRRTSTLRAAYWSSRFSASATAGGPTDWGSKRGQRRAPYRSALVAASQTTYSWHRSGADVE